MLYSPLAPLRSAVGLTLEASRLFLTVKDHCVIRIHVGSTLWQSGRIT